MYLNIDRPHRNARLHRADCRYVPADLTKAQNAENGRWYKVESIEEAKRIAEEWNCEFERGRCR